MQGSITVDTAPALQYLLRLGDTLLILAQRTAEWCGHAPVLEEDIAMSNIALDLLGQARAVLAHAGRVEGRGHDEDALAFLRDERDYRNVTLVELPRGDFAVTVLRNTLVATFLELLWQRLAGSADTELAGIAAKAVKEARYHRQHSADWVVRLADGTEESRRRMETARDTLWRYVPEFFAADAVDAAAQVSGLGPGWPELEADWRAGIAEVFAEAGLDVPPHGGFVSTGKRGIHSEHMGLLLAEMQHLQRAYPGGVW